MKPLSINAPRITTLLALFGFGCLMQLQGLAASFEFVGLRGSSVIIKALESGSANVVCYVQEARYANNPYRDTVQGIVFWNRYNLRFDSAGDYSFEIDLSKARSGVEYTLMIVNHSTGIKLAVPLQIGQSQQTGYSSPPSSSGNNNPGAQTCFIATAAYGTPWESQVLKLRIFRERFLLQSEWGKSFVSFYYRHSPPVAHFIEDKPAVKWATRLLLTPIVVLAGALLGNPYDIAVCAFAAVGGFALIVWRKKIVNRMRGVLPKDLKCLSPFA